jgi:DNA-binding PadR family transcriptional regulator
VAPTPSRKAGIAPPLKPAVFYILLALADRESHGYAVMQAVGERSGGQVTLRTGSFYRHLSKLIDSGLVLESPRRPADDDPRRGAYYRLTPRGARLLEEERLRLTSLLAAMDGLRPASRRGSL